MPVVAPSWSLGAVPGAVWSRRRLMAPVPAALLLLSSFLPALAAEQGRPEYPEFRGGVYVSGQLHSGAAEWLGHLSHVLQVIQPAQYPDGEMGNVRRTTELRDVTSPTSGPWWRGDVGCIWWCQDDVVILTYPARKGNV